MKRLIHFILALLITGVAVAQTNTNTRQIRFFPVTVASDTVPNGSNDGRMWYDFTSDKIRAIVNNIVVTLGSGGGGGSATWGSIGGTLSNQIDLQAALDAKANEVLTANTQVASYILALTDKDSKVVVMNVGSANTLTVPPNSSVAFPVNTVISVNQQGAGLTTIVPGSGVTVNPSAGVGEYDSPGENTVMVLWKTATDTWQLWNGTGSAVSSISTTSPITGGIITSSGTIGIDDAAADGATKGAASFTANDFDATSGNIATDYTNGQAASAVNKGFLTSADWTTFNNKQASGLSWLLTGNSNITTPTITGVPTFIGSTINQTNNLVVTPADGLLLENTTAATGGVTLQISPSFRQRALAWKTSGSSQPVDFRWYILPVSAATVSGSLILQTQVENGGYINHYNFSSGGALTVGVTTGTITANGVGGTLNGQTWNANSGSASMTQRISQNATPGLDLTTNGSINITTYTGTRYTATYAPTSGSGTYIGYAQNHILNTTGTYSGGTHIGFDHNPTTTSVAGLTHIAYRATSGAVLFGGTTLTAGSVLMDLQSTTRGVLFPRVTNIASVATPVNGMIAYDAATNLFNFYQGSAWRLLLTNGAASGEFTVSNGTNLVGSSLSSLSGALSGYSWAGTNQTTQTISSNFTGTITTSGSATQAIVDGSLFSNTSAVEVEFCLVGIKTDGAESFSAKRTAILRKDSGGTWTVDVQGTSEIKESDAGAVTSIDIVINSSTPSATVVMGGASGTYTIKGSTRVISATN